MERTLFFVQRENALTNGDPNLETSAESAESAEPSRASAGKVLSWPVKLVYLVLALFFFVLGMIGVVLPGLPTTPFLLLMGFFLVRVSPRMHAWILTWPLVGKPLTEWDERGGVRIGVKILAYAMVGVLVLFTLLFRDLNLYFKLAITLAAIIGLIVVYRLPTIRDT